MFWESVSPSLAPIKQLWANSPDVDVEHGARVKNTIIRTTNIVLVYLCVLLAPFAAWAQARFEDDRVMLQGFYWESYRHGHPAKFSEFGEKTWYRIVADQAEAIRNGRFDLIWLPPPSFAGARSECADAACSHSAGYNPKEYFVLDNSYGSFAEQRSLLQALLEQGIEPVADLVLNHRDSSTGWAGFRNPAWGTWSITRDDEAFTNPASEVFNTPVEQRGAPEEAAD